MVGGGGDSDEKRRNPLPPPRQLLQDSRSTGGGARVDSQPTRRIFPARFRRDVDFTRRGQITAKIKLASACFGSSATCDLPLLVDSEETLDISNVIVGLPAAAARLQMKHLLLLCQCLRLRRAENTWSQMRMFDEFLELFECDFFFLLLLLF